MEIKHNFVSAKSDGGDTTQVQPSHWNAVHTITMAAPGLIGKSTAGAGSAVELASVPISLGGTGLTTVPTASVLVSNASDTLVALAASSSQSIRRNSGNTAWEAYTPSIGDVVLVNNNAFTGANSFYNATGQTFGTATTTNDGLIISGRSGGVNTYRVTLSPGTLTASRSVTFPDAAGAVVLDTATQTLTNKTISGGTLSGSIAGTPTLSGNITFTGTNTFLSNTGQVFAAASINDGFAILGSSTGSASRRVTLNIASLTTNRSVTFPDAAGNIVLDTNAQTLTNKTLTAPVISTITNSGTLTLPTSTDTLVGRATTDTLTNKTLDKANLVACTESTNSITSTATTSIDCSVANVVVMSLAASITSLLFTNIPASGKLITLTLFISQTGSFTITWPAAIKWPGGTAPTLSASGKVDVITLCTHNAGTTWYGFSSGLNY